MSNSTEEKILKAEEEILAKEKEILKQEQSILQKFQSRSLLKNILAGVLLVLVVAIGGYWRVTTGRVFTDKAEVSAPLINLSPERPGVLKSIMVREGDTIAANAPVARVGDELLSAKTSGVVVMVNNEIGMLFSPGIAVVSMIDRTQLRVTARVDENNGLRSIRPGQRAVFTADAFGSRQFAGVVDSIAQTAEEPSVVFSISDKRPTKEFVMKIKYDTDRYPELLNGMSARVWIYTR